MIETELENMVKEMDARLQYQGMKFEQYLKMVGKTMEDFKKENEEQAKTSVKTKLVLEGITFHPRFNKNCSKDSRSSTTFFAQSE